MKHQLALIIGLLAASCCLHAAQQSEPRDPNYRPEKTFTEFKGLSVLNLQNQKLGRVEDITVDLQNARLVEVLVTTSGFLGMGRKTTAVPPKALSLDFPNHVLRLDVSKAKFDAAPKFHMSNVVASSQPDRVAEVFRYFGFKPWFFLSGQTGGANQEILRMGYVLRGSLIIGMPVINREGAPIGRVNALSMDLPKGQVVHVVVTTDAQSGTRSVIQARSLRFDSAKNALMIDDSSTNIAGEPRFKWTRGNNRAFQEESYVNRDVDADNGLHSRQNARAGIVANATAMDQGENFRDEQKTARIMRAIQADPSLSANAKNVEVVTYHAQTTLRGHVNTEAGKQKIGKIAARAGRPENVSNLLEVRPLYAPSR